MIVGLQCLAILLAWMQSLHHVLTDEAKYLLNIPYPHPPLVRTILGMTAGGVHQEFFWRIIFATAMIHSVWLVWDIGSPLKNRERTALCIAYLLCGGVFFHAGDIMMAPLTGVQILLFLWLFLRPNRLPRGGYLIGLLWLGSLFTAYQALFALPLVFATAFHRNRSFILSVAIVSIPIFLLALYTLTNPAILATMALVRGLAPTILPPILLWLRAGSILLAVLGLIGLLWVPSFPILTSLLLYAFFLVRSPQHFYDALLPGFVIVGIVFLFRKKWLRVDLLMIVAILGFALTFTLFPPSLIPTPARAVLRQLSQIPRINGSILIHGPFGHEWQYEAFDREILRDTSALRSSASAIICIDACDSPGIGWRRSAMDEETLSVEVWAKKVDVITPFLP